MYRSSQCSRSCQDFFRMCSSSRSLQHRRVAAAVFAALFFFYFFFPLYKHDTASREIAEQQTIKDAEFFCDGLHGLQDIFLILRTGANEAMEKLPIHFNTSLRCLPRHQFGIWSDLQEDISGYTVENALVDVSAELIANHPDFVYYRRLQEAGRSSFTAGELNKWATTPNGPSGRDSPGWKLDKWKFLPIVNKAYRRRPDAKWFVFMEGDTYMSWNNILHWLSRIDSSKPYYMGREMQIGDVIFGHGGSGFIMSNPAVRMLVEHLATTSEYYEEWTGNHWAGDCVLGKAMKDAGVDLSWQGANFFGASPFESDYNITVNSPDRYLWCYYITTYHHVTPSDIDQLFRLETRWGRENSSALRHGDVFRSLILPKIGSRVDEWDNGSEEDEGTKATFEECRHACEGIKECVQFVFYEGAQMCKTSKIIKLGHGQDVFEAHRERAISGWMMDRVNAFIQESDRKCLGDRGDWILPS